MKVRMIFDGNYLSLRMEVEDDCERAMTELMEAYNVASVAVTRKDRPQYESWNQEMPVTGLSIVLRKPVGTDTTSSRQEGK